MSTLGQAIKVDNIWTGILSSATGENVNYQVVNTWLDGTPMDDSKLDGFIYRKRGNEYLKLVKQAYTSFDLGLFPVSDYTTATSQKTDIERVIKFAVDSNKPIVIPPGNYVTDIFRTGYASGKKKAHIIGCPGTNIYLKYGGTSPVLLQIWDDCILENINFYSLETDLNMQRAGIENQKNIVLRNCGFFGFRSSAGNGWGLYLKNAKNITIDNCRFGNNSQSDITIVDGNENINIINPVNDVDNGVYLNVEPNGNIINKGINVIGGYYRRMTLLVNTLTENPIQAMTVTGCTIDDLLYDGANVEFIGCTANKLSMDGKAPACGNFDASVTLGNNLIEDPYLLDFVHLDTTRKWILSNGALLFNRIQRDFTRFGDRTINNRGALTTTSFIPLDINKYYLFAINAAANYYNTISFIGRWARLYLFDESYNPVTVDKFGGEFTSIQISFCRFPLYSEGSTGFVNQACILNFSHNMPETVKFMKLEIGSTANNNNELDVRFVSLNEITAFGQGEKISSYISRNMPSGRYYIDHTPPTNSTANRTTGAKSGDLMIARDGSGTWLCIDGSTRPATWSKNFTEKNATTSSVGLVKKSDVLTASQPSATAPTAYDPTYIKTMRDRVEDLIQKLKDAGIQS